MHVEDTCISMYGGAKTNLCMAYMLIDNILARAVLARSDSRSGEMVSL